MASLFWLTLSSVRGLTVNHLLSRDRQCMSNVVLNVACILLLMQSTAVVRCASSCTQFTPPDATRRNSFVASRSGGLDWAFRAFVVTKTPVEFLFLSVLCAGMSLSCCASASRVFSTSDTSLAARTFYFLHSVLIICDIASNSSCRVIVNSGRLIASMSFRLQCNNDLFLLNVGHQHIYITNNS